MTTTTTITAATARQLYADGEGEHGDTTDGWTLIGQAQEHQRRQSRWHQRHWLIVRNGSGEDYGLDYGIGLTENQDHDFPWQYTTSDRELELVRLYPHTITRVEYRTTPAQVPDRDHAGLGLPCTPCAGPCTIDDEKAEATR